LSVPYSPERVTALVGHLSIAVEDHTLLPAKLFGLQPETPELYLITKTPTGLRAGLHLLLQDWAEYDIDIAALLETRLDDEGIA